MVTAKTRRWLLGLHRQLGIHLGLLLLVICLTGTLAVLGQEWDWLLDPALRADSATMNWAAVDAQLRAQPGLHVRSVFVPSGPGRAATVLGDNSHGQFVRLWLTPATGEVGAVYNLLSIQFYLRQLHRSLLVPRGIYAVGLLGLMLTYMVLSGLLVYPRFWRGLGRLRLSGSASSRWTDLHRTTGVWVALFALLIGCTGVWYGAEQLARDSLGSAGELPPPRLSQERLAALPLDAQVRPLPDLVAAATRAMPDLDVRAVHYPERPGDPVRVDGQTGALLVRDRASRVYLDPYSAEVVGSQRAQDLDALPRWVDTADELHFGTLGSFGGLGSKLVYFALGLLLCFALVAGPILARTREAKRRPQTTLRRRGPWGRLGVGTSAVATIVLLLAAPLLTSLVARQPFVAGHGPVLAVSQSLQLGPLRGVLTQHAAGARARYVLHFGDEPSAALSRVTLQLPGGATQELPPGGRPSGVATLHDAVELELSTAGGARYRAAVTLSDPEGESRAAPGLDSPPARAPDYVLPFIVALLLGLLAVAVLWITQLTRPLWRRV